MRHPSSHVRDVCRWLAGLASVMRLLAAPVDYEREIAPIFRSYCVGCHNRTDLEGGFSVETYARLRTGGTDHGDPIQPHQPEQSFLFRAVTWAAKPHMPPKDEPQVPDGEREILRRWIADGAPGPKRDESILAHIVVPTIAVRAGHQRPVTALAIGPEGRVAIGTSRCIELQMASSGPVMNIASNIPGKVNAIQFLVDGRRLVVASGVPGVQGVAQLLSIEDRSLIREFSGHSDLLSDAVVSPDGRLLATGGYDRALKLWDIESGACFRTNTVHNGPIFSLAFDPSGRVLASASADQTVKLWRVTDGVRLDTLNQAQAELNRVLFTPDGSQILAAGADRRIYQWRFVSTNSPGLNPWMASRFAHEAAVTALAISSDGHLLVSAGGDRTLKLWSLPDLVERKSWSGQSDVIDAVAFEPASHRFVVGRLDGTYEFLDAPFDFASPPAPTSPQARQPVYDKRTGTPKVVNEVEPNGRLTEATVVDWPVEVHGGIQHPGDADLFRFQARAGEPMTLAIYAAQGGSQLDSRIEVLFPDGKPVPQLKLQAVRDSWFTFRGKDSETSDDFRLQNYAEMELDQYLYANGEVTRLWLYPRGPDSGFKVYPGEGRRQPLFGTTAVVHALNEPCYIVEPLPLGATATPNGLPIFQLNYENDDDPSRQGGTDSLLRFVAPATGEYLARVTDVRGFGGHSHFDYKLTIREARPDFQVKLEDPELVVSPGSARELQFVATRIEGFDGPIQIVVDQLPEGFSASTPLEIEAGQIRAIATLSAAPGTVSPPTNAAVCATIRATAMIDGKQVAHAVPGLKKLQVGPPPKVTVSILPGTDPSTVVETPGQPLEFRIHPGQTISAVVRADRRDFTNRIEFGNEDSGRNLPHGVYVDNIGLNGLLIVEGQSQRDFFIHASAIAQPGVRRFHLRTTGDGGQCSPVATLRVLPALQAAK